MNIFFKGKVILNVKGEANCTDQSSVPRYEWAAWYSRPLFSLQSEII